MAVSGDEQVLLDKNREYLYDYLGSAAYDLAQEALSQSELSRNELDTLSETLQNAFDSVRFFEKTSPEAFSKPLLALPSDTHESIQMAIEKGGISLDLSTGIQNGFMGLYLLKNTAFFPVAPNAILTQVSISYQSDYSEVPASVSLFGDENGAYTLTEELLPELTLENGAFGTFGGWYLNPSFTTKAEIGQSSTSTILYAKWSPTTQAVVSELYLYGIAESIRRLTGSTTTYTPAAMVTALRSLKGS